MDLEVDARCQLHGPSRSGCAIRNSFIMFGVAGLCFLVLLSSILIHQANQHNRTSVIDPISTFLQEICDRVRAGHGEHCHPEVAQLASTGPKNAAWKMRRLIMHNTIVPEVFDVPTFLWDKHTSSGIPQAVEVSVPVLLPSMLLSWAFKHHRDQFWAHVVGSRDGSATKAFWSHIRPDDSLAWGHPVW